jgi:hypothetical protein
MNTKQKPTRPSLWTTPTPFQLNRLPRSKITCLATESPARILRSGIADSRTKALASDVSPADIEFEYQVKSIIEQISARSHEKFDKQAYEIMLSGAEFFQDKSTSRSSYRPLMNSILCTVMTASRYWSHRLMHYRQDAQPPLACKVSAPGTELGNTPRAMELCWCLPDVARYPGLEKRRTLPW